MCGAPRDDRPATTHNNNKTGARVGASSFAASFRVGGGGDNDDDGGGDDDDGNGGGDNDDDGGGADDDGGFGGAPLLLVEAGRVDPVVAVDLVLPARRVGRALRTTPRGSGEGERRPDGRDATGVEERTSAPFGPFVVKRGEILRGAASSPPIERAPPARATGGRPER